MRKKIANKNNLLSICFYKIDYEKVNRLLRLLKIDTVSIFIDEGRQYVFYDKIRVENFVECLANMKDNILIFDDQVTECSMDREVEVLLDKKILIAFVLDEKETHILINLEKVEIQKADIKSIMK